MDKTYTVEGEKLKVTRTIEIAEYFDINTLQKEKANLQEQVDKKSDEISKINSRIAEIDSLLGEANKLGIK